MKSVIYIATPSLKRERAGCARTIVNRIKNQNQLYDSSLFQ